jgi:hypothetical protein
MASIFTSGREPEQYNAGAVHFLPYWKDNLKPVDSYL